MIPSMIQQLQDYIKSTAGPKNRGTQKIMYEANQRSMSILEFIEEHGPMSAPEIAKALNMRPSSVHTHLERKVKAGVVTFDNSRPRKWSLRLR